MLASAGIVLEPTSDKRHVAAALACLGAVARPQAARDRALAYATARAQFRKGGVNRIFLAPTAIHVGISDNKALEAMSRANATTAHAEYARLRHGNYNEAMMERIADVGNGNYAISTAR